MLPTMNKFNMLREFAKCHKQIQKTKTKEHETHLYYNKTMEFTLYDHAHVKNSFKNLMNKTVIT